MNYQTNGLWVLDTPQSTPVDTRGLLVCYVRWVSPGAQNNDQLVLQNQLGQNVWEGFPALGPQWGDPSPYFNPPMLWNGLIPATIGSGRVYVYFSLGAL